MSANDVLARVGAFLKNDGGTPAPSRQLSLLASPPAPHPIEKTIWGSPAGKKRLAARLVKLIPPHQTYVEPFAGSGAVFFEKTPVAKEVLGDADPEIAFAFGALKSLTDADVAALKKKSWTGSEQTFAALRKANPKSKVDKLHRFLYLSHFAYGKLRGKSFNHNAAGIEARTIDRIEKFRDRLKKVVVRHGHYVDLVKEFDGKDTFFFLDPPYPGYDVNVGEGKFDEVEFRKVLDGIKGRFLVTYGTRGKLDTSGFEVRKIRPPRSIRMMRGVGGPVTLPQLLIANYTLAKKSLGGEWGLDEVEGVLDLSDDVSADLEQALAFAKALDLDTENEGPLALLVAELDKLDSDPNGRTSFLARGLAPLAARLVPELRAVIPSVAKALEGAAPELERLAKIHTPAALVLDTPHPPTEAPKNEAQKSPAEPPSRAFSEVLVKRIPLVKTGEERYVLGIVLEPETVDAQSDIYSGGEVRDAAHKFMSDYQNLGLMHREQISDRVQLLESYLAPCDFDVDGTTIKKGTWLLAVRVADDGLWKQIKEGGLTGFSIGGSAVRTAAA